MTCLCAFNSLQGSAQVAGSNNPVVVAAEQRRITLRDSILNHISGAKIAEKTLFIKNFGAKNDGKTDCRSAFAKAIKKAALEKAAQLREQGVLTEEEYQKMKSEILARM